MIASIPASLEIRLARSSPEQKLRSHRHRQPQPVVGGALKPVGRLLAQRRDDRVDPGVAPEQAPQIQPPAEALCLAVQDGGRDVVCHVNAYAVLAHSNSTVSPTWTSPSSTTRP